MWDSHCGRRHGGDISDGDGGAGDGTGYRNSVGGDYGIFLLVRLVPFLCDGSWQCGGIIDGVAVWIAPLPLSIGG